MFKTVSKEKLESLTKQYFSGGQQLHYEVYTTKSECRYSFQDDKKFQWINGHFHFLRNYVHREDGPAFKEWYKNGQLRKKWYLNQGKFHREDGPTCKNWYGDGQIEEKGYYVNGKKHRDDGPT